MRSKYKRAIEILWVADNAFNRRPRQGLEKVIHSHLPSKEDVYMRLAAHGYYWDITAQDWIHLRLDMAHRASVAEITGQEKDTLADAITHYWIDGGILERTAEGKLQRLPRHTIKRGVKAPAYISKRYGTVK